MEPEHDEKMEQPKLPRMAVEIPKAEPAKPTWFRAGVKKVWGWFLGHLHLFFLIILSAGVIVFVGYMIRAKYAHEAEEKLITQSQEMEKTLGEALDAITMSEEDWFARKDTAVIRNKVPNIDRYRELLNKHRSERVSVEKTPPAQKTEVAVTAKAETLAPSTTKAEAPTPPAVKEIPTKPEVVAPKSQVITVMVAPVIEAEVSPKPAEPVKTPAVPPPQPQAPPLERPPFELTRTLTWVREKSEAAPQIKEVAVVVLQGLWVGEGSIPPPLVLPSGVAKPELRKAALWFQDGNCWKENRWICEAPGWLR